MLKIEVSGNTLKDLMRNLRDSLQELEAETAGQQSLMPAFAPTPPPVEMVVVAQATEPAQQAPSAAIDISEVKSYLLPFMREKGKLVNALIAESASKQEGKFAAKISEIADLAAFLAKAKEILG